MGRMERLEVDVGNLLLDLENPRIVEAKSQAEALQALIEISPRNFRTILKSIKDNGLDPGDTLYVLNNGDGDYVVLEGNRRASALMVLANPELLEGTELSDKQKKSLIKAAAGFDRDDDTNVRCTLFPDRGSANAWIERRHTGHKEGEGRIEWGPLEIQRFRGDRTVLDVIDFVGRNAPYDDERWSTVRAAVDRNSSTLDRFLRSRAGKDTLGMTTKKTNGEIRPYFARKPEFAARVLTRLFDDIADGNVDSRSHNKAASIRSYFESLPKTCQPSAANKSNAQLFAEASVHRSRSKSKAKKKKSTQAKPPRRTLSPRRFSFAQPPTNKGQALIREATKIKLDETPMAAAYLLRAVLEHTIDYYMTVNRIPFREQRRGKNVELDLATRYERVKQHLIGSKRASAKDLRGATSALTTKSDPASIQSLNDYHHSRYRLPTVDALRTFWDNAEPFFAAVYGEA